MTDKIETPVVSEDMSAAILAAIARVESLPNAKGLIDSITDDEWLSDDPDMWMINAGSEAGDGEIDTLDAPKNRAA